MLAAFGYDDLGRRTSLTRGNTTVTSYGYDPVSRLATLTDNMTGSTNDQSSSFSYNPASQIGSVTRTNDLYAWTGHGSGSTAGVANGLNQLTSVGGSATAHDSKGNLTFDPMSGKTYSYSSENLLTGSTGGTAATLSYDPLLRLYQFAGASTLRFAYDGLDMIAEYDAGNTLQSRYVFGPGADEPLVRYDGAGNRTWYSADERGSIISLSNDSGTVTSINSYGEYGKPQSTNSGRFQYTGQMWLPELAAYYYKARVYSPTLGRFFQVDPVGYGAGINLYAYVGDDPVNFVDPSGLCPPGEYRIVDLRYRRRSQSDSSDPSDSPSGDIVVTGPPCRELDISSSQPPALLISKPKPPQKTTVLRRLYRWVNPDPCSGKGTNEGAGVPAGYDPYEVDEKGSLAALYSHVLPDHDFGSPASVLPMILAAIQTNPAKGSGGSLVYTINTGQYVGFDAKHQSGSDYITVIMGPKIGETRTLRTAYPGCR